MIAPDLASLVQVNLGYGRDRARTIGAVAESMGIARRQVERAVETLRLQGVPICSGREGIWLTTSGEELLEQYHRLRARYIHQAQGARALRRTAERYGRVRQMEMFG